METHLETVERLKKENRSMQRRLFLKTVFSGIVDIPLLLLSAQEKLTAKTKSITGIS